MSVKPTNPSHTQATIWDIHTGLKQDFSYMDRALGVSWYQPSNEYIILAETPANTENIVLTICTVASKKKILSMATEKEELGFLTIPAWSPDGKTIALAAADSFLLFDSTYFRLLSLWQTIMRDLSFAELALLQNLNKHLGAHMADGTPLELTLRELQLLNKNPRLREVLEPVKHFIRAPKRPTAKPTPMATE